MNGQSHYRVAEQHIEHAKESNSLDVERVHLQYAQVHATLAQAAAHLNADLEHHEN